MGCVVSNARHGRSEDEETIEGLRAQLEQVTAALAAALAQQDQMSAGFGVAADGTGPVPRVTGHRSHRVPREARWLRVVPGLALPLGLATAIRRAVGTAHHATALSAPVSVAALSAAVVVSLGPSHTLEDRTPYAGLVPSVSSPAERVPVSILPASRLSSDPKVLPHVTVKTPVRLPFTSLAVPAPVPAVPRPSRYQPQPRQPHLRSLRTPRHPGRPSRPKHLSHPAGRRKDGTPRGTAATGTAATRDGTAITATEATTGRMAASRAARTPRSRLACGHVGACGHDGTRTCGHGNGGTRSARTCDTSAAAPPPPRPRTRPPPRLCPRTRLRLPRRQRPDLKLSPAAGTYAVTAVCGMLDAACFLKLGNVFVEIVTGNIALLAFSIGTQGVSFAHALVKTVPPYLVALGAFAVGAVAGGRMVQHGEFGRRLGFITDAALIGEAALVSWWTHPGPDGSARYVVFGLLAVAMGIQNAIMRRWGTKDLATNLMTLTLTGLLADSRMAGGSSPNAVRRGVSIAVFTASAAAGAVMARYGVMWPVLAAFIVFAVALPVLLRSPVTAPVGSSARSASRWLSPEHTPC